MSDSEPLVEEALRFLQQIQADCANDDDEQAHVHEDQMHKLVIKAVIDGEYKQAKRISLICRYVEAMSFARWYA